MFKANCARRVNFTFAADNGSGMSDVIGLPRLGVDIASTGLLTIGVSGTSPSFSSLFFTILFVVASLTTVGSSMTSSSIALSMLSFDDVDFKMEISRSNENCTLSENFFAEITFSLFGTKQC